MNVEELFAAFRDEADDDEKPYLWSDPVLLRHLNAAYFEAARRSRLIRDAITPEVTRYPVAINQSFVKLHPSVIAIVHAQMEYTDAEGNVLAEDMFPERVRVLDAKFTDWRRDTGDAHHYVEDMQVGQIRLTPIPTRAGKLVLEVARMPKCALSKQADCPELPAHYHEDLVQWMVFRAFSKKDSDTFDGKRAADALALFEQVFGRRSSAIDETETGRLGNRQRTATRFF